MRRRTTPRRVVCWAEILDEAEMDGILHFSTLLYWVEKALDELIAINWLQVIAKLTTDAQLYDSKPLSHRGT